MRSLISEEEISNDTQVAGAALAVQTFYISALRNHLELSSLADRKANVLLGVNSIILGIVLTNVVSELTRPDRDFLIYPLILFVTCCLVTIILSIAVTRPQNTTGTFTEKDMQAKKVNLAFFGNFHSMRYEEYQRAVDHLFKKTPDIYEVLTIDLFYLGKVLERKYRMLQYTFLFFVIGLCLSVLAFIISYAYHL
jgi:hypothetical protein